MSIEELDECTHLMNEYEKMPKKEFVAKMMVKPPRKIRILIHTPLKGFYFSIKNLKEMFKILLKIPFSGQY